MPSLPERVADLGELGSVILDRLYIERAAREAHLAGGAVRHDMDGVEPSAPLEHGSDLGKRVAIARQ